MQKSNASVAKYNNLLNYYIDAVSSLVAMHQAKNIAESYENSVVHSLASVGAQNGVFVTPADIPEEAGEQLVRESLNAHLSKVQSDQISQKTLSETSNIEAQAKSEFVGKKIILKKEDPKSECIDAVLFNSKTGEYRVSQYTKSKIKGTIKDISFENNLLVIQPTLTAKLINPNRHLFYVYVINLKNMLPEVDII